MRALAFAVFFCSQLAAIVGVLARLVARALASRRGAAAYEVAKSVEREENLHTLKKGGGGDDYDGGARASQ